MLLISIYNVKCIICRPYQARTLTVRAFCFGRRVCRLSVPRQISKIKRDRREISSPS